VEKETVSLGDRSGIVTLDRRTLRVSSPGWMPLLLSGGFFLSAPGGLRRYLVSAMTTDYEELRRELQAAGSKPILPRM
jgi:hypothetical protein